MSLGPLGNGPFPVGNRERGWGWLIKLSAQWQVFAFQIVPKDSKSLTRGCIFFSMSPNLKAKALPRCVVCASDLSPTMFDLYEAV